MTTTTSDLREPADVLLQYLDGRVAMSACTDAGVAWIGDHLAELDIPAEQWRGDYAPVSASLPALLTLVDTARDDVSFVCIPHYLSAGEPQEPPKESRVSFFQRIGRLGGKAKAKIRH